MFLSVLMGAGILLLGILVGQAMAVSTVKHLVESTNKTINQRRGE